MINTIFDACVQLLLWMAQLSGLTYKAVNVWIFVVLWPIFTLMLIAIIVKQYLQIRALTRPQRN